MGLWSSDSQHIVELSLGLASCGNNFDSFRLEKIDSNKEHSDSFDDSKGYQFAGIMGYEMADRFGWV